MTLHFRGMKYKSSIAMSTWKIWNHLTELSMLGNFEEGDCND